MTVAEELVVNELRAVVGVKAEERKGELRAEYLEAGEDMELGLVFQGFGFGPSCGNVCEGEGLTELIEGCATVVRNEISFAKPGALLVPIGKGSDGDVMFEQGPGSSE